MAIEKLYTVYDVKAEYYVMPFVFKSNGEALRWFSDAVNAFDNRFYAHPEDYVLFEVGTYDNSGCTFDFLPAKKSLLHGIECVNEDARKRYIASYNARMGISASNH